MGWLKPKNHLPLKMTKHLKKSLNKMVDYKISQETNCFQFFI